MEPVEPKARPELLPPGTRYAIYAEHQTDDYIPLPSARTPDGRVMSAWRPSADELALLNAGEPIYLVLHTFNQPLQPIQMTVGHPDLR